MPRSSAGGQNTSLDHSTTKRWDPGPPIDLADKQRVAFHLEEFKALKAEIAEDLKLISANFQFAVILSGGIAAWMLAKDHVIPKGTEQAAFVIASWLPLLFSALFGFTVWAISRRFDIKGGYIRTLEGNFRFDDLGWEHAWDFRKHSVGKMVWAQWSFLGLLDLALGSVFTWIYFGTWPAAAAAVATLS
jgi:hypothetical protein